MHSLLIFALGIVLTAVTGALWISFVMWLWSLDWHDDVEEVD